MVDWAKKIRKSVGGDLAADEQVEAGLFVQPSGATGQMMATQLGGVVGAAIASRKHKNRNEGSTIVSDQGIGATLPKEALVLGLTSRQMYVWGHGSMSGKPKGLKTTIPLSDINSIEFEKGKMTSPVTIHFTDGSGTIVEAPKMTKPQEFVDTFQRLKG